MLCRVRSAHAVLNGFRQRHGDYFTNSAGGNDDGTSGPVNGGLITVGGFDDPFSPFLPDFASDHERYNLAPVLADGTTKITVRTNNRAPTTICFLQR